MIWDYWKENKLQQQKNNRKHIYAGMSILAFGCFVRKDLNLIRSS